MDNKVSVIIRTGASRIGCLEQAIASVSAQRHKNIEIVIVENGSKGLQHWLKTLELKNCELRYYHLEEANRCLAGNLGIEVATGNFVCFLDDDDIFYPNHLDILVATLEVNVTAAAAYAVSHEIRSCIESYTPFQCIDEEPQIVFRRKFSRGALFVNNYLPIQAVLFRKKLFAQHGGFDNNLQRLEDWDLWVRYASQSDFIFVDVVTSMYRMPSDRSVIEIRNSEHDKYYPFARQKQSQILTIFDCNQFDEVIKEIFLGTKVSSAILQYIYKNKLSDSPFFNVTLLEWGITFNNGKVDMSVLDGIKLASEVITRHKFLWNVHRAEILISKKIKKILSPFYSNL